MKRKTIKKRLVPYLMSIPTFTFIFTFIFSFNFIFSPASNVFAQEGLAFEKAFTLSPFVGGYLFEGPQHLKTRPYYGLRFGPNLSQNIGIEGMFAHTRTRSTGSDNKHIHVYRYGIDGLYRFMADKKLVPFLALGPGAINFDNPSGRKDNAAFILNYGPGIMLSLSNMLALRADVRHVINLDGNHYNNFEGTLGLNFLFGGNKERKPASSDEIKNAEVGTAAELSSLKDIHFDYDDSTIMKSEQDILDRNIQILKENAAATVKVEGHASAKGTEEYNQELSERRADSVASYMIHRGKIDKNKITTIGYGETKPVEVEADPEDKLSPEAKANMRVHFEAKESSK